MPKRSSFWIHKGWKFLRKKARRLVKKALGIRRVPTIVAYRGYGNETMICIQGHVLEDKRLKPADEKQNAFVNTTSLLKRFLASPFPHAQVRVRVGQVSIEIETDSKGFFEAILPNPHLGVGWHEAEIWLTEEDEYGVSATKTQFLIPSSHSIGIISDIDDTFLISHSTNKWRKLPLLAFNNAATRKPFDGVATMYQAFCQGHASEVRPFFCVSSSEWNLYDFLTDFCQRYEIPQGVLLLQDLKTRLSDFKHLGGGTHRHKLDKIERIFHTYPYNKFILLGDSGQKDPELYYEIAKKYPHQVAGIYIRYVKHKPSIRKFIHELNAMGIEMRLFRKSEEVLQDARRKGILAENSHVV